MADMSGEILPWQREILDTIEEARKEGRTKPRIVHGRRGSFLTFVAPDADPSVAAMKQELATKETQQ